jgi:hypothetical protein
MQGGRSQQTMPEDRTGWHQINAGPHLEVLFHPNRRPGGREPDQIVRPSIVVAVAGKREQALRFDPFVWAPTTISGQVSPNRSPFRSRRDRVRSMPPWHSLRNRFGSEDF